MSETRRGNEIKSCYFQSPAFPQKVKRSRECNGCNSIIVQHKIFDIGCHVAEDVLSDDKGECVICLEELSQGDTIARLPCLCIYHKG